MSTDTVHTAPSPACPLDPGQYLTGVQSGWHAVASGALQYAAVTGAGIMIVPALCGRYVRLAPKHGIYRRDSVPVTRDPCPECAWMAAVATSTVIREIEQISPGTKESAVLTRHGFDPLLPAALCRAVLAAAEDPAELSVIRQLAAITRHRPALGICEECADDGCPCPGIQVACWTCSLLTGDEAGEQAGQLMEECTVTEPCSPLKALAAHYGPTVMNR